MSDSPSPLSAFSKNSNDPSWGPAKLLTPAPNRGQEAFKYRDEVTLHRYVTQPTDSVPPFEVFHPSGIGIERVEVRKDRVAFDLARIVCPNMRRILTENRG